MPYYIGDVIQDEKRLVARTPERFRETGIEVKIHARAEGVDRDKRAVRLADGAWLPWDALVLGTGVSPALPGIPGEDLPGVFTLKTLSHAVDMKAYLKEHACREAVIVGGGFIGLEMAEAFVQRGIATRIIGRSRRPAPRWDAAFADLIRQEMDKHAVPYLGEETPLAIEKEKGPRLRVVTTGGELPADLVLIAAGVRPNTGLAQDLRIPLGPSGAIPVNFSQNTVVEGVYAVGDCCEVFHRVRRRWVHVPLGDIANKQGRVAGRNIGGRPLAFPGIVGAQSFKLFGLELAATGVDEKEAAESGFDPVATVIWGKARGGAMPDNPRLGLKLLADKASGLLLGAQAVGALGAVARVNTLSAALWAGLRLDEVAYLDLAYAPPFSGAWDPLHVAAQTLLRGA